MNLRNIMKYRNKNIKQHDITDCGAVCLLTIINKYGYDVPLAKIRKLTYTDKKGTSAYGIIKAAEILGFLAKGIKFENKNDIKNFEKLPMIAHVVIDNTWEHYVVVNKVSNNRITISDPAKGIVHYSEEDFFDIWDGVAIILSPSENINLNKIKKSAFGYFGKLLIPNKKIIVQISISALFITLLEIAVSFYFSYAVEYIAPKNDTKLLIKITLLTLLMFAIRIMLQSCKGTLLLKLNKNIDTSLMMGSFKHMLYLPLDFYSNRKTGDIVSRFTDASKIREALSSVVITFVTDVIMVIFGGLALFKLDHFLSSIVFIMIVIYSLVVVAFKKTIRNNNLEQMKNNSGFSSYLTESIIGAETIKSCCSEKTSEEKMNNLFSNLINSVLKCGRTSILQQSLTDLISNFGTTIIIGLGIQRTLELKMTIGTLIAFNSLIMYFFEPVKSIIQLYPTYQTAQVAFERLNDIFDLEPEYIDEERELDKLVDLKKSIKLHNLNFSYNYRASILKNINLTINYGEKIGFVGESGSGKTTLSKLLLKFYPVSNGSVLIGDKCINEINTYLIRKKISYISQNVYFFNGTILDNLTLGIQDVSFDKVKEICKMCKIDDFVRSMPNGYNTLIDENGSNLSCGQKELLSIARCLLNNPDILIMDEATSNLDSVSENAINDILRSLHGKITIIIIAHRLNNTMDCDCIYVMENGKIIERGNHKDLLELENKYFQMWKLQFPQEEL